MNNQTNNRKESSGGTKTITVDQAKCIGCGLCISTCPDVFEFNDNGKSRVKEGADCQKVNCCEAAIDVCPAKAIGWTKGE